jgi:hydroxypyruvate isomerase
LRGTIERLAKVNTNYTGGRVKFSANVSILFKEVPFVERFERAREAGFSAVEFWWPSGEDLGEVESAVRDAGLKVALFNFDAGDMPRGDRGLLSDPERAKQFRENVPVALELAKRLGCRRLNALVGHELEGMKREEQLELARENSAFAADRASEHGIEVLIEAVNTFENGPYLLCRTCQAAGFVNSIARQNVKLLYDVYHMQRMEGNLVATLREYIAKIAHMQVADSPGRGEPGTGEINYPYVFGALEDLGYDGYLGLEYNPTLPTTEESLRWLPKELRSKEVNAKDLDL